MPRQVVPRHSRCFPECLYQMDTSNIIPEGFGDVPSILIFHMCKPCFLVSLLIFLNICFHYFCRFSMKSFEGRQRGQTERVLLWKLWNFHFFLTPFEQQNTLLAIRQSSHCYWPKDFFIWLQRSWKRKRSKSLAHPRHGDRRLKLALDICCVFACAASCAVRATWLQTTWNVGWVSQWALSQLSTCDSNFWMRG